MLLVEGDPHLLRITSHLLIKAGYEVIKAGTGADGLRLAQSQKPDLILLDVDLPDMDSLAVCQRIKKEPDLANCFVVMLSGAKTSSDDQASGPAAGADGYIVRPDSDRELLAWVEAMLRIKKAEERAAELDRTEHVQAEKKLRESEQKFRTISEQSLLAIGFIQDGLFKYANQAYCDISGYSLDEIMNWKPYEYAKVVHPDDRKFVMEQARKKQAGAPDSVTHYQFKGLTKGGETKWLELYSKTILYQERNADLVMFIDITERKQAEEALRESEMNYRSLVDQSLLGILIIQGGRIRYANKMITEKGRFSTDELTSLPPAKVIRLIHPQDRKIVWNRMLSRLSGKNEPARNECRLLGKDGTVYWSDVHTNVIKYLGKPAIQMCIVDITDRKQAEQTLQRYNQRLMILHDIDRDIAVARSPVEIADKVLKHIRRLVSCWRASVVLYEPDAGEIVVLASNASGQTALKPGMRFPDPAGRKSQKLIDHYYVVEDLQALPEPLSPAVRMAISEGIRSYLSVLLFAEENLIGALVLGRKTPVAFSAQDIEIASEIANQLAIAIHQTRLKEQIERYAAELEDRVAQRTAQLESANKDLESFSYSVSHDLRAPLRAISGFAAIIARRHRADLNEEGRHYVDNIVLASERMGYLIDDLLQYSRLGRRGVRRERVSLHEVFDPLAGDLAAHLAEIGGTLRIAADLPIVTGDRTLLSQVFTNLLENAITYRKPDVPVQVTVSCQTNDKDTIVCVSDNGIGIPSEYKEKIFDIFQRLHSEDEYPGTGIGLSNVKKSVELLGGRVWVESVVGKGSKFFIQLPKE